MDNEKVARCTGCRSEFSEAELVPEPTCCPNCGSKSVPSDPRLDIQLTISPHELRILTIWASNYAQKLELDCKKSLAGILSSIRKQHPKISLTLDEELNELVNSGLCESATLHNADGSTKEYKGTKPS